MINGMIFDFDGTLFDSMSIWETASQKYLRSIGKEPQPNLTNILKPMSLFQAASYIKENYAVNLSVPEIKDGINRTVEDFYFHTAKPKDGVSEWIKMLAANNIRMCIATATDRYLVEAALMRYDMLKYFSAIFTCTEVGSGKDKPFIFRMAMEHLKTQRCDTFVVEDAFHAVKTAKSDGFMTIAIYDAYEQNQTALKNTADLYLKDYTDLTLFWKLAQAK